VVLFHNAIFSPAASFFHLLWPPCVADADIIFLNSGFFFLLFLLSSSFFSSPNLSGRRVDVCFYTWCSLSANLECRSDMCCTRLAGNAGPKNGAKSVVTYTCLSVCWSAKSGKPCRLDGKVYQDGEVYQDGKVYQDGEEFKPNCSLLCTCQNGAYACASLCPQEDRAPSRTHCRDAQLVSIVGQCCREWVCPHVHSIAEPDDDANNNGN